MLEPALAQLAAAVLGLELCVLAGTALAIRLYASAFENIHIKPPKSPRATTAVAKAGFYTLTLSLSRTVNRSYGSNGPFNNTHKSYSLLSP